MPEITGVPVSAPLCHCNQSNGSHFHDPLSAGEFKPLVLVAANGEVVKILVDTQGPKHGSDAHPANPLSGGGAID